MRDASKAVEWYRASGRTSGDPNSIFRAGVLYHKGGPNLKPDFEQAITLLELAANLTAKTMQHVQKLKMPTDALNQVLFGSLMELNEVYCEESEHQDWNKGFQVCTYIKNRLDTTTLLL